MREATTLREQRDVARQQRDELLLAMRLIEHATKASPDDGGSHEAAHAIATEAIAKFGITGNGDARPYGWIDYAGRPEITSLDSLRPHRSNSHE